MGIPLFSELRDSLKSYHDYPENTSVYSPELEAWIQPDYDFISAKVVADSIFNGVRILSFVVEFPRWILAEANTHRVWTRSYASSRAIPAKKMLARVRDNPVVPSVWGKNQSGMQSAAVLSFEEQARASAVWLKLAAFTADCVAELEEIGLHKQWANRPLETFITARGIITSTEWTNAGVLRLHKDAQPEFLRFMQCLESAAGSSTPVELKEGQWHMPFITAVEKQVYPYDMLLKFSTARCARASYNNVDGTTVSPEKDLETYDKLITSRPIHASPAEHQAQAVKFRWWNPTHWFFPRSNLNRNFRQYRKFLELEAEDS